MATVVDIPFELGAAPAGFKPGSTSSISQVEPVILFPAGPSYLGHVRRNLNQRSFVEDDEEESARVAAELETGEEEDDLGVGEESESEDLLASDPKDWKHLDLYAVLGLSKFRYKATPEQIKIAHRKKVLKHHPDKKAGAGGLASDDAFFKCIAKAHEILSTPEKRRQFDSVDPAFTDDDVPTGKEPAEKFFELWGPVFEREARFSEPSNGPIPSIGNEDSSKEDVDAFYSFWYNFDSWRSFEYLDKEVNEGSDSRDEKRYIEKKNRAERAKLKKEDNTRLRSLVDKALATDPRIKKFKAEEKAAREARRKGRTPQQQPGRGAQPAGRPTPQQVLAAKKAKAEEEQKAKADAAQADAASKADREAAKKQREAAKKKAKKEKKAISTVLTAQNYFQPSGTAPSAAVIESQLNGLDALVEALDITEVTSLRAEVEKAGANAKAELNKTAEAKGVATGVWA